MKRKNVVLLILFGIFSSMIFSSVRIEFRIPEFDKKNSIEAVYAKRQNDHYDVTVVFSDEDHPNPIYDFVYDVYRFFKYGRIKDIETFYVYKDYVIFGDTYCNSTSYFQTKNLHKYAKIPIYRYEKSDGYIVIYVSTWNHMFSEKPLNGVKYISYRFKEFEQKDRLETEYKYSWFYNKTKKAFVFFFLGIIFITIIGIFGFIFFNL